MKPLETSLYLLITIIILAGIMLCSCSNNKHNTTKQPLLKLHTVYKKKNFDSLMNEVEKGSGELDFSEELLADKTFVEIFEHDSVYFADVEKFLAKDNLTDSEAIDCIFAMQNLKVNDYVKFCSAYAGLYDRNKIKEPMLETAISPNFLNKKIITENYTNPGVIALLQSIRAKHGISTEFKKLIDGTLSGG